LSFQQSKKLCKSCYANLVKIFVYGRYDNMEISDF
jgi:hypothetical protein